MISDLTNRGRMSIQKEREAAAKHKSMKEIDTAANGADIHLSIEMDEDAGICSGAAE